MSEEKGFLSQSGLTESEAKEMHGNFVKWFQLYKSH